MLEVGSVHVHIDTEKIRKRAVDSLDKGMKSTMRTLVKKTRLKIGRTQPTRVSGGGRLYGLSPSKPGEPPKRVSGTLYNSITFTTSTTRMSAIGAWGAPASVDYAIDLEVGTDTMEARPYLRPVLHENRRRILKQVVSYGF